MPLQELNSIKSGKIALWYITENENTLLEIPGSEPCPENIMSANKRLEWICGRLLIRHLVAASELDYKGIEKDEFGKPFLRDSQHHISLSHSYPYVAAQIHPDHSIGIDIEQPKEKLLKIAPRVLNASELENAGSSIAKHCIYWCAKEALYKIFGKRGLLFTNHLHVKPFELADSGDLEGWIEFNDTNVFAELHYIVAEDYVLVHSKTN